MNRKQQKTLDAVLAKPVHAGIEWTDVQSLLFALGAEIKEARGSRVLIKLKGMKMVFHRPHPQKEIHKAAVKALQQFLQSAGVES